MKPLRSWRNGDIRGRPRVSHRSRRRRSFAQGPTRSDLIPDRELALCPVEWYIGSDSIDRRLHDPLISEYLVTRLLRQRYPNQENSGRFKGPTVQKAANVG